MKDSPAKASRTAPEPRRRGPRSDLADTRQAILDAARRRFSQLGYDARIRDIARDADVDPALVSYHFGNKAGLFSAAMALEANPAQLVERAIDGPVDGLGERLLRMYIGLWDDPRTGGAMTALVRSATSHEQAASMLRGFVERELLGRLAAALDTPDRELRAALAGSQLIGLAVARQIVGIEPLASRDAEELVAEVAPTLQRYLTGALPGSPS